MQEITTTLSLAHSHDFASQIGMDQLQLHSIYLKTNKSRIKTAFGLCFRRRSESSNGSIRHNTVVVNQILRRWGFSNLCRQGRKRKRIGGVQSEDSMYCLRSAGHLSVNVYEHIRLRAVTWRREHGLNCGEIRDGKRWVSLGVIECRDLWD